MVEGMEEMKKRVFVWMNYKGRLKVGLSAIMVILLITVFTYDFQSDQALDQWSLPLSGKIVALDAGHGGPDPGAVGGGLLEKDVNLAIVKHLRDYLQQAGAIVVVTRDEDVDLASEDTKGWSRRKAEDLMKRANLIKNSGTDLFVTIHLNSIPSPRWYGAQTFYRAGDVESQKLAFFIQNEIIRNLENTERVSKPISEVYLLEVVRDIPSVLVEVGFLSNPNEARLLSTEKYQKKMAASIYNGILSYLSGEKVPERKK